MHIDLVRPDRHGSLVDLLCELYRYYHDGIHFYAGLGAQRVADRLSYRLALHPAAPQDVMRFQPDRTAAFMRSHVDEPLLP
jgi:hypothetical protein